MSISRGIDKEDGGSCIQWNISHKKKERMLFAAIWMDVEIIILNEVRKKNIT